MINGKAVEKVHYLKMLRSLQRMQEKEELNVWYICDKGQLLNDFVQFSGIIPAPANCIVTYRPIKSWTDGHEFQWFCRIRDDEKKCLVYFTLLDE